MPNYCDYQIRVKGYKDNVDEFIRIIQADYNYNFNIFSHDRHFFRVFEAEVYDEEINGVEKSATIGGYCAWSVVCCMFDGALTYYDSLKQSQGENFRGTHIVEESRRLNLDIEIFSEEMGMGFQEHYYMNNGVLIRSEECDIHIIDLEDYETPQQLFEKTGYKMDQADFDYKKYDGMFVTQGGYDWNFHNNINPLHSILAKSINKGGQ